MSDARPATALDCDVLVVGGGGAGMAAAIEAATLGASVLLMEKGDRLGGSTARSVGSVTAVGTPHQRLAGIEDSPDDHFEDMALFAGPLAERDNPALRRVLVDRTGETFAWLCESGLEFIGPSPEPPHRRPRMHNVVPNSGAVPHFLGKRLRGLGVEVRLETALADLVVEAGEVRGGLFLDAAGNLLRVSARRGVVLATGDYSASREMKAAHAAPRTVDAEPVNPLSTGDGMRIAMRHGAVLVNGDIVHGPRLRFVPPPRRRLVHALPPSRPLARLIRILFERLPGAVLRPFILGFLTTALGPEPNLFRQGALLVNRDGAKVEVDPQHPALNVPSQPGNVAFIVFDRRVAELFETWPHFVSTAPGVAYAYLKDYRRTRPDITRSASTLEELAGLVGVPPAALRETVERHNAALAGAEGRVETPPFHALGPAKGHIVITEGGLAVDEEMAVLDAEGAPIPGLFAAGSTGQGGLLLEGHGHHLVWAFTSGRIAGRSAAQGPAGRTVSSPAAAPAGGAAC